MLTKTSADFASRLTQRIQMHVQHMMEVIAARGNMVHCCMDAQSPGEPSGEHGRLSLLSEDDHSSLCPTFQTQLQAMKIVIINNNRQFYMILQELV